MEPGNIPLPVTPSKSCYDNMCCSNVLACSTPITLHCQRPLNEESGLSIIAQVDESCTSQGFSNSNDTTVVENKNNGANNRSIKNAVVLLDAPRNVDKLEREAVDILMNKSSDYIEDAIVIESSVSEVGSVTSEIRTVSPLGESSDSENVNTLLDKTSCKIPVLAGIDKAVVSAPSAKCQHMLNLNGEASRNSNENKLSSCIGCLGTGFTGNKTTDHVCSSLSKADYGLSKINSVNKLIPLSNESVKSFKVCIEKKSSYNNTAELNNNLIACKNVSECSTNACSNSHPVKFEERTCCKDTNMGDKLKMPNDLLQVFDQGNFHCKDYQQSTSTEKSSSGFKNSKYMAGTVQTRTAYPDPSKQLVEPKVNMYFEGRPRGEEKPTYSGSNISDRFNAINDFDSENNKRVPISFNGDKEDKMKMLEISSAELDVTVTEEDVFYSKKDEISISFDTRRDSLMLLNKSAVEDGALSSSVFKRRGSQNIVAKALEERRSLLDEIKPPPTKKACVEYPSAPVVRPLEEFISSNVSENADNNHPKWQMYKGLSNNQLRYECVRKTWLNPQVPNVKTNLSCYNWRARNRMTPLKLPECSIESYFKEGSILNVFSKAVEDANNLFDEKVKVLENRRDKKYREANTNYHYSLYRSNSTRHKNHFNSYQKEKDCIHSEFAFAYDELLTGLQERLTAIREAENEMTTVCNFYNGLSDARSPTYLTAWQVACWNNSSPGNLFGLDSISEGGSVDDVFNKIRDDAKNLFDEKVNMLEEWREQRLSEADENLHYSLYSSNPMWHHHHYDDFREEEETIDLEFGINYEALVSGLEKRMSAIDKAEEETKAVYEFYHGLDKKWGISPISLTQWQVSCWFARENTLNRYEMIYSDQN